MTITLTKKELEIMQILWSSKEALSATDIIQRKSSLKMSTVQAVLRSLLNRSYIKSPPSRKMHPQLGFTIKPYRFVTCFGEKG